VFDGKAAKRANGARDLEVRDHDHHAEQQRDGVEVNRLERFLQALGTERDHRRPAEKRDSRPVEAEPWNATDRHAGVGQDEDRESGDACPGQVP
jgi:hypothetical protein